MDLKCAFENITVPTELAGIDDIIANINDGIKSCSALSFFLYKFPKAERKRTLDGDDITAYYKPQIYLKSKEWFNLIPDDRDWETYIKKSLMHYMIKYHH